MKKPTAKLVRERVMERLNREIKQVAIYISCEHKFVSYGHSYHCKKCGYYFGDSLND